MREPFFSVVMATFNRGVHIGPSIESVLRQTFTDFELIVVGDGCTDSTEQHVKALGPGLILCRNLEENSGSQSAPNNEGMRHANGRWICYLGHDDIWAPDHLQRLKDLVAGDDQLDVAVGGCIYYGPEGSGVFHVTGLFEPGHLHRHFFPPSSFAHRRDAIERIGPWRPPWAIAAPVDCDFLLRAMHAGLRFASSGRITVHKFAAGHRYLSYLRPSSTEQTAMLGLLRQGAFDADCIIAASKHQGLFMTMRCEDYSAHQDGFAFQHNRKNKGLSRPALQPLTTLAVISQADDPRGLDWHQLEQLEGQQLKFRWSGPSPTPRILVPFSGSDAKIEIEVVSVPPNSELRDLSISVEGEKIDYMIEGRPGRPLSLVFRTPLRASADTIVTLHTPTMFCPADHPGGSDRRKLGAAVADIVVAPA